MLSETQLVLAVAGVCVLAAALLVLGRRRRSTQPQPEQVRGAIAPDAPGRLVLARTHDGTQYQGVLVEPGDASAGTAYLTLEGPIVFRRAGGEAETMPSAWDRLALPVADVAEVWTRPALVVEPTMPTPSSGTSGRVDESAVVAGGVRGTGGVRPEAASGDQARASRRHARGTNRSDVPTS